MNITRHLDPPTDSFPDKSSQILRSIVENNDLEELRRALAENIISDTNINMPLIGARTALHIAAEKGLVDITELLLQAGANPYLKAVRGFTPLHLAVQNNHQDIVKILLRKDDKLSLVKAEKDVLPLHIAVSCDHIDIVRILLTMSVQHIDSKVERGYSSLRFAILRTNKAMIDLLLENHCPVTQEDMKSAYERVSKVDIVSQATAQEIAESIERVYHSQKERNSIHYIQPILQCLQLLKSGAREFFRLIDTEEEAITIQILKENDLINLLSNPNVNMWLKNQLRQNNVTFDEIDTLIRVYGNEDQNQDVKNALKQILSDDQSSPLPPNSNKRNLQSETPPGKIKAIEKPSIISIAEQEDEDSCPEETKK